MDIICSPDAIFIENVALEPTGPDEPYLVVTVSIKPADADSLIETLDSNSSTARAARDPLSRQILEAINQRER